MAERRRSLRNRRHSHHVAAEPAPELEAEAINRERPTRKRQRRLTAHQRLPAKQHNNNPDQRSKKLEVASKPAPEPVLLDEELNKKVLIAPLNNDPQPSNGKLDFLDDEDDSCGYVSSGPSVKMAPGKRIKWRVAISEEDVIRQNLSWAFMGVAESASTASVLRRKRR